MKLFLSTTPTFFVEEDKILTALFDAGLEYLYLDKPGCAPVYMERLLSLLPKKYYKRIITCQHYYLQSEYHLLGIHLTPGAVVPEDYKGVKGIECHTAAQVAEYRKEFSYVTFGPFPHQEAQQSPQAASFIEEVNRARTDGHLDKRVIAFGDIDEHNIKDFEKLRLGGVILSSTFWNNFDTRRAIDYDKLISSFTRVKELID